MTMQITSPYGKIDITYDVIATLAGGAALDVYGLVGMASRKQLKDGIAELLGRENLSRGIEVYEKDGETIVDMYIIVSYGTKITEVANNVQQKVIYTLQENVGLKIDKVNVYVQGVRVLNV